MEQPSAGGCGGGVSKNVKMQVRKVSRRARLTSEQVKKCVFIKFRQHHQQTSLLHQTGRGGIEAII